MNILYYLKGSTTVIKERSVPQRIHLLRLGKLIFLLACLSLPVALYGVTDHPAYIVIFTSGLGGIGVYPAHVRKKKEEVDNEGDRCI